jgi:hypothetical protein
MNGKCEIALVIFFSIKFDKHLQNNVDPFLKKKENHYSEPVICVPEMVIVLFIPPLDESQEYIGISSMLC